MKVASASSISLKSVYIRGPPWVWEKARKTLAAGTPVARCTSSRTRATCSKRMPIRSLAMITARVVPSSRNRAWACR